MTRMQVPGGEFMKLFRRHDARSAAISCVLREFGWKTSCGPRPRCRGVDQKHPLGRFYIFEGIRRSDDLVYAENLDDPRRMSIFDLGWITNKPYKRKSTANSRRIQSSIHFNALELSASI